MPENFFKFASYNFKYWKDRKNLRLTSKGRHILSASDDTNSMLWDVETGEALMQYGNGLTIVKNFKIMKDNIILYSNLLSMVFS